MTLDLAYAFLLSNGKDTSQKCLDFINGSKTPVDTTEVEPIYLPSEKEEAQPEALHEVKQAHPEANVKAMMIELSGTPEEIMKLAIKSLNADTEYSAIIHFVAKRGLN